MLAGINTVEQTLGLTSKALTIAFASLYWMTAQERF